MIALEGSFTKAAQRLHISQSSLSEAINKLEYSLKTSLFIRNPKGITLTTDGEKLFYHTRNIIIEAENAKVAISQHTNEIAGNITLAAPYGFTSTNLFLRLTQFLKLYPEIHLTLICNDEDLDLKTREADVSIRNYNPNDSGLQQTYLTSRIQHLYASQSYLEKYGFPKKLEDLKYYRFISFNNPNKPLPYGEIEWVLKVGLNEHDPPRQPALVLNSVECLYQAALEGLGIVALSHDSDLLKEGKLLPILPMIHSPEYKMYLIYPNELKGIKIIKELEAYLVNSYRKN
jgi:DNA-binding transcriptional LysR family regulator